LTVSPILLTLSRQPIVLLTVVAGFITILTSAVAGTPDTIHKAENVDSNQTEVLIGYDTAVRVVYALKDIPDGTPISSSDLEERVIERSKMPEWAVTSSALAEHRMANHKISAGQILTVPDLAARRGFAYRPHLQEGMRVMSFIPDTTYSTAGFVSPGDHVDIIVERGSGMNLKSYLVLSDVEMLDVGQENKRLIGPKSRNSASPFTVALNPIDARRLYKVYSMGLLYFNLSNDRLKDPGISPLSFNPPSMPPRSMIGQTAGWSDLCGPIVDEHRWLRSSEERPSERPKHMEERLVILEHNCGLAERAIDRKAMLVGDDFVSVGKPSEAEKAYALAWQQSEIPRQPGIIEKLGGEQIQSALTLAGLGDYREAEMDCLRALALLLAQAHTQGTTPSLDVEIFRAEDTLGWIYLREQRITNATAMFNRCLESPLCKTEPMRKAFLMLELGSAYQNIDDFDMAGQFRKKAALIAKQAGDKTWQGIAEALIAENYHCLGQTDLSNNSAATALALLSAHQIPHDFRDVSWATDFYVEQAFTSLAHTPLFYGKPSVMKQTEAFVKATGRPKNAKAHSKMLHICGTMLKDQNAHSTEPAPPSAELRN